MTSSNKGRSIAIFKSKTPIRRRAENGGTAPAAPAAGACPGCGKGLKTTCPACGKPIEPDWKACPACGAPVDPGASRNV